MVFPAFLQVFSFLFLCVFVYIGMYLLSHFTLTYDLIIKRHLTQELNQLCLHIAENLAKNQVFLAIQEEIWSGSRLLYSTECIHTFNFCNGCDNSHHICISNRNSSNQIFIDLWACREKVNLSIIYIISFFLLVFCVFF